MLPSSNRKLMLHKLPQKCPRNEEIDPNNSKLKPQSKLRHISGQSITFRPRATGEKIWNRAITSGNVSIQSIPPANAKPITLRLSFCIIHGSQPRFSITSRSSVRSAFSSSFQCGRCGAIQINPATHKNDK